MKNVNPLHILALLFVVLIFLYVKLSSAKTELSDAKESYQETLALSSELRSLKETYGDKKSVQKAIAIILKQHSLKSAKIKKTTGSSSITLHSQSMDKVALNSIMSKILNGSYNVRSYTIKRLRDTKVSFTMEIQW